jgi:tetratricopeptide (TPR) repeat protein
VARAEVIDLLDGAAGRHKWYDLQIDLRYARLDEAKRLYGREDPRAQSAVIDLAWSLTPEGRAREAYDLLEEYIPNLYELLESGEVNQQKYELLGLFANIARLYGGYEAALEYHERALKMAIELETPDGPWDVYYHQIMISRVLWRLGRLEEALQASDDAKRRSRPSGARRGSESQRVVRKPRIRPSRSTGYPRTSTCGTWTPGPRIGRT